MTGQDRRPCLGWRLVTGFASATRIRANTSVLAAGCARRPASALTCPQGHTVVESLI